MSDYRLLSSNNLGPAYEVEASLCIPRRKRWDFTDQGLVGHAVPQIPRFLRTYTWDSYLELSAHTLNMLCLPCVYTVFPVCDSVCQCYMCMSPQSLPAPWMVHWSVHTNSHTSLKIAILTAFGRHQEAGTCGSQVLSLCWQCLDVVNIPAGQSPWTGSSKSVVPSRCQSAPALQT